MRTKVDFSINAEIMLGITRKNSKDYSAKLDAYKCFISGILYTLMFLEKVWHNQERHGRAARRNEAIERL